MRVKLKKYEKMKAVIKTVVDHYYAWVKQEAAKEKKPSQLMWALFFLAADDMRYDDCHPRYQQRDRIIPHTPEFDMYSDGDNDDHLTTALLKIGRELGITRVSV